MPQFMTLFGYHIYFWSNEGMPLEPVHVHVSKNIGQHTTKIWIHSDGTTQIDGNYSEIPKKDLKRIEQTVSLYSDDIIKMWEKYFQVEAEFIDLKGPEK